MQTDAFDPWDIFHDDAMNLEFARCGYVIIDVGDHNLLERLRSIFEQDIALYTSGFMATLLIPDVEHRRRMQHWVSEALRTIIQRCFKRYRSLCGGFAVKQPDEPDSAMPMHQDISMLQPGGRPGLSFWLPLVPTDIDNGCLQVVPGSHLFNRQPRAPGTPLPLDKGAEQMTSYLQPLPTRLGQAIVIDQALFHSSPPNRHAVMRTVATSVLLPQESQTFYYFRNIHTSPVTLEAYAVDDEFYLDHRLGTRPVAARPVAIMNEILSA
jgi:hypothetical protein